MKFFASIRSSLAGILIPAFLSCSPGDNFVGGGGAAKVDKKPPEDSKKPPISVPVEQCKQAKLTSVKSLNEFVNQSARDRKISIELTFEACGNQMTNLQLPIKFDLDADMIFSAEQSIPYELMINGISASSGNLQSLSGADLFDNVGSQYVYFKSSSPLEASPKIQKAILNLDLRGVQITGPANSTSPTFQNFSVPSHIKVGDTPPVTGQFTFSPVAG